MATSEEKRKGKLPVFQKRFNELRANMSQDEFAKFIGVSRATIGFYENGERVPDAITLNKIADACEVDVDYLLGRSDIRQGSADDKALQKRFGFEDFTIMALQNFVNGRTGGEDTEILNNMLKGNTDYAPSEKKDYIGFINRIFATYFEEIIKDLYITYENFKEDKREESDYYKNESITDSERRIDRIMFDKRAATLSKIPKHDELDLNEDDGEQIEIPPIRIAYFDSEGSLEFMLNMVKKKLERMIKQMYEEEEEENG